MGARFKAAWEGYRFQTSREEKPLRKIERPLGALSFWAAFYYIGDMLSLFPDLFAFQNFAPLILRVVLGVIFIVHGWPKLFKDNSGFAGFLETLGFKPGIFWAYLVAAVEFFGGVLLVLGFLTQLAAALIALEMLVVIFKVKFQKGLADGYEFDLALLAMAVSLMLLGPGAWSLDLPL